MDLKCKKNINLFYFRATKLQTKRKFKNIKQCFFEFQRFYDVHTNKKNAYVGKIKFPV